jgi:hypothetical protein
MSGITNHTWNTISINGELITRRDIVTRREPLDVTVGSRRAQVRSAKYTVKSAFRAHGELQLLAKKSQKTR